MVDHVLGRRLGLLDLLTLHGAGDVDHDKHVACHDGVFGHVDARRGEQDKVTVFARRLVAQQVEADGAVVVAKVEIEVALRLAALGLIADQRRVVSRAVDADRVVGAVDGAQTGLVDQLHADGDLLHRRAAVVAGAQRVVEVVEAVLLFEHLRVGEVHRARLAGGDGEDAGLEEATVEVFEQGGVQLAADDLFVDAPRLLAREQLALHGLAIDGQLEVADRGVLGQGEDVDAFSRARTIVAKDLGHVHIGHGSFYGGFDAVLRHDDAHARRPDEDRRRDGRHGLRAKLSDANSSCGPCPAKVRRAGIGRGRPSMPTGSPRWRRSVRSLW